MPDLKIPVPFNNWLCIEIERTQPAFDDLTQKANIIYDDIEDKLKENGCSSSGLVATVKWLRNLGGKHIPSDPSENPRYKFGLRESKWCVDHVRASMALYALETADNIGSIYIEAINVMMEYYHSYVVTCFDKCYKIATYKSIDFAATVGYNMTQNPRKLADFLLSMI